MRILALALIIAAGVTVAGAAAPTSAPVSATPTATNNPALSSVTPELWLSKFQNAWDSLHTYEATITAREYLNGKIQDRVYDIKFQKPSDARVDIVGGDGRGSAAVWHGGDHVVGHQGGWLSMIHLNLNIHNHIATSMRGRTIAQASFGAALDFVKAVKWKSEVISVDGDRVTMTAIPEDPTQAGGATKEVMTLGPNWLPAELTEYENGGSIARHESYSNIQVNVTLPDSTWHV